MSDTALPDARRQTRCFLTICRNRIPETCRQLLTKLGDQAWPALAALLLACNPCAAAATEHSASFGHWSEFLNPGAVTDQAITSRVRYLADALNAAPTRTALQNCTAPGQSNTFSIAHRGAPALFPEHTREAYLGAISQGAGIIECDVTFTSDGALVCRHSQCDLHTTTNILETPLAAKCRAPFTGAGADGNPASAQCCTNDITLAEFRSLCGKHDSADTSARTAKGYMQGSTDLSAQRYPGCGTLMSLDDSIALIEQHGRKHAPELKAANGPMPFSQSEYAQLLLEHYKRRRVPANRLYPQSFNPADIGYWLTAEPDYAQQAVLLDSRDASIDPTDPVDPGPASDTPDFTALKALGLRYLAPPIWYLLSIENDAIVPSRYALQARAAGLELIAWSLERSGSMAGVIADPRKAYYYQSVRNALQGEGDVLTVLDVLAREVGVSGVFSDWPATTTVYANCLGPTAVRSDTQR
ncbi:MAG: glycerophosphodiester phosphodiesterase family protein [Pseudomonadales bacterium]